MTNLTDLDVTSLTVNGSSAGVIALDAPQTASADGAITIKNGVVIITKATAAALTLANPTSGTDDYKVLRILSTTAVAHTVTVTGGFGNAGAGADVATFPLAVGATLSLLAYGGYWYVIGSNGVTLS